MSVLLQVLQAVTVKCHHARLGAGEETREKDEACQDGKEKSQRGVVQTLEVGVSMFGDC